MTIHGFLATKRDGLAHTEGELRDFVRGLVTKEVSDYQASAWLMAAYLNGLNPDETVALTLAMADSGERLDLAGLPHPIIDKHSTGGVGDTVTLLFLPIMAACGVPVVKMSGRGLGFTGGTLDKLESIPGFRTSLSTQELVSQAKRVGCALGGQTADLAPADKILYALRDATETIGSIPLIAASVMSKKLAAGADAIVLDVKAGSGAFMKDRGHARKLARTLISIGVGAGKRVRAFVSDMDQPLAPAVGNALEVRAAIRELQGGCEGRLGRLSLALCNAALEMAGKGGAEEAVASGAALAKMREWFAAQGGDSAVVDDDIRLPAAPVQMPVACSSAGFVSTFDVAAIGEAAREMRAGRLHKDDVINPSVGIEVHVELGQQVVVGDLLFTIHAASKEAAEAASDALVPAVSVRESPIESAPLFEEVTP